MATLPDHLLKLFQSHVALVPTDPDEIEDILECDKYTKCRTLVIPRFFWEALQESGIIITKPVTGTEVQLFIPSIFRFTDWSVIPHGAPSLLIIISHMMLESKDLVFWKELSDANEVFGDQSLVDALIQFGYGQNNQAFRDAVSLIMYG